MKVIKYIFFGIILFLFVACSDRGQQIAKEIKTLQSKAIKMPSHVLVMQQSKVINKVDDNDKTLKLIVYTDSVGCTSCAINQINLWSSFIDYADQFKHQLKFYFLFSPVKKDLNSIKSAIACSMFDYPIVLDTLREFEKLNTHLPTNRSLHTFLLDENNNVILVGNPMHNKRIEEMFYKIVEEKLGKPQEQSVKDSLN